MPSRPSRVRSSRPRARTRAWLGLVGLDLGLGLGLGLVGLGPTSVFDTPLFDCHFEQRIYNEDHNK